MIREYGMPAILRRTPRHVTAYAAGFGGMRFRQFAQMTRFAACVISLGGWRRLRVGIVTSSTPQLALAVARACAQRQLLGMADHFEGSRAGAGVDREYFFQPLARMKVGEIFARVEDALGCACEMALFADTVARRASQLGRVDDGAWDWKF